MSEPISASVGAELVRNLSCALANARYALEYWEREAAVCAKDATWALGPIERGRVECANLRDLDNIIRPIAYPQALGQSPASDGEA